MNILGINPGHNGSAALLIDGELEFYIEEERLSRSKYDGNPFRGIIEGLQHKVDVLIIGGTENYPRLIWTGEDPYSALVRKFNPDVKVFRLNEVHHSGHAANAFYGSGFDDAAAIIVDGAGGYQTVTYNEEQKNSGWETESIFDCDYEKGIKVVYQSFGGNQDTIALSNDDIVMDSAVTIVKAYEAVSEYLGFGFIEAGKTMGLAPYGKASDKIPPLFEGTRGNKNILTPAFPGGAHIDHPRYPYLTLKEDPRLWHKDSNKVTDAAMELAWAVQEETQKLVGDLIEKAVEKTGKSNIVISGGYGLNCVANYYYKKRFPDLNIYVDPIAHDGGTALGMAYMYHYTETKDKKKRPLTSLYLGVKHKNFYDFKGIKTTKVKPADIAKLISEKNIVAMFQGRSEAGPRALGNRSILYDPTDPQGKDVVNQVKGREWFRPFAGSMMQEHFEEWFDTYGMKESPYMMYAMDFKLEKHGEVPAITHVDGTCRIQTVTKEQNKTYYELIQEFKKITGVPILFNTSFNLAGQPLVETLHDAVTTVKNSDIKYLYLPEEGKLVHYPENDSRVEEEKDEAA
tara:strand:- start:147 stop:1856 length:1710 start_codon:yes stop_codon:yes gene_type:complete